MDTRGPSLNARQCSGVRHGAYAPDNRVRALRRQGCQQGGVAGVQRRVQRVRGLVRGEAPHRVHGVCAPLQRPLAGHKKGARRTSLTQACAHGGPMAFARRSATGPRHPILPTEAPSPAACGHVRPSRGAASGRGVGGEGREEGQEGEGASDGLLASPHTAPRTDTGASACSLSQKEKSEKSEKVSTRQQRRLAGAVHPSPFPMPLFCFVAVAADPN